MSGKPFLPLNSDEEAERFVAEADLTEYDFTKGHWVQLNLKDGSECETTSVDLTPADMETARHQASREGVPVKNYLGRLLHEHLERIAS